MTLRYPYTSRLRDRELFYLRKQKALSWWLEQEEEESRELERLSRELEAKLTQLKESAGSGLWSAMAADEAASLEDDRSVALGADVLALSRSLDETRALLDVTRKEVCRYEREARWAEVALADAEKERDEWHRRNAAGRGRDLERNHLGLHYLPEMQPASRLRPAS